MDRHVRGELADHREDTEVGHDHGIHPGIDCLGDERRQQRDLPVARERVDGQVDAHAACMRERHGLMECSGVEVRRALAHPEHLAAEIDRVCAEIQCRAEPLGITGGREHLGARHSSPSSAAAAAAAASACSCFTFSMFSLCSSRVRAK